MTDINYALTRAIDQVPIGGIVDLKGDTFWISDQFVLRHGRTIQNATFIVASYKGFHILPQYDGEGHMRDVLRFVKIKRPEGAPMDGFGVEIECPYVGLSNVDIRGFGRALQARNQSYIWSLDRCWLHDNKTALWFDGVGLVNSGENIALTRCNISGNENAAMVLTGCHVSAVQCSFDYNGGPDVHLGKHGHFKSALCHFENRRGHRHVREVDGGEWSDLNSTFVRT